MPTYVIGDVHGCFDDLQKLLELIQFNPSCDQLWFTGDLIHAHTRTIETLAFIHNLGDRAICVLGNHDLTLLAAAFANIKVNADYSTILAHSESNKLLTWLRTKPLIYYSADFNTLLVHAGLAPQWTLQQALQLGKEVSNILTSPQYIAFLQHLLDDGPKIWHDELTNWERARCIVNYMTTVRFCTRNGALCFHNKGPIKDASATDIVPWFTLLSQEMQQINIVFGHWSTLNGVTNHDKIFAVDTGCIWGNKLTALRLEDKQRFFVNSTIKLTSR